MKVSSRRTSILLILDRGFDVISPIVHEFTLQAMAYDLLDIKDDMYKFKAGSKVESIPLNDEDSLWRQLRHEHIANLHGIFQKMIEGDDLMRKATKHIGPDVLDVPALDEALKKHLQLKSHERYFIYRYMANEIMMLYTEGYNVLYQLEQNLSTKTDTDERPVRDMYQAVTEAFESPSIDMPQKLRLLLLYIFYNRGIKRSKFDNILSKAHIEISQAYAITNVMHLDIDLFKPGYCEPIDSNVPKKEVENVKRMKQSRWIPVINDILIGCVDGTLSEVNYPYLRAKPEVSYERTGYWCSDKKSVKARHLVVFIAGGVTYSEMRCVYEVMSKYKGWEIFIGGDDILTPNVFMEKLRSLPGLYFLK